jgi:uncharacterized phage protein gp47/JayE
MSIEAPSLEIRNAAQLAAAAIGRVSSGLTPELLLEQIENRRELLKLVEEGLETPICPEATNANPSATHTVVIETMAWLLAQQAYRLNQVPFAIFVAFANLFGIEQRVASAATGFVLFTVDPPSNTDVTIPIGTEISTQDGSVVFTTTVAATIEYGDDEALIAVRRTVNGHTLLQPDQLTKLIDPVAYVTSVTNPTAIDSGSELEKIESALERVKRYQRRGERIVSTKDLEDAILDEGLLGNGIVRAFPFVVNGDYSGEEKPGHTTVVVMTRTGDSVDAAASQRIASVIEQAVGNQFIYIVDPEFVDFDVEVIVRLTDNAIATGVAVQAAIERNLRNFYAAAREQFGRGIYASEIVAEIEGTAGVDRVERQPDGALLAQPAGDTEIAPHELARLVDVMIGIVA